MPARYHTAWRPARVSAVGAPPHLRGPRLLVRCPAGPLAAGRARRNVTRQRVNIQALHSERVRQLDGVPQHNRPGHGWPQQRGHARDGCTWKGMGGGSGGPRLGAVHLVPQRLALPVAAAGQQLAGRRSRAQPRRRALQQAQESSAGGIPQQHALGGSGPHQLAVSGADQAQHRAAVRALAIPLAQLAAARRGRLLGQQRGGAQLPHPAGRGRGIRQGSRGLQQGRSHG